MRITFMQFPGDFQRFDPEALEKKVGSIVAFSIDGLGNCQARLEGAKVIEDGKAVEFTVEVGRDSFPNARVSFRR